MSCYTALLQHNSSIRSCVDCSIRDPANRAYGVAVFEGSPIRNNNTVIILEPETDKSRQTVQILIRFLKMSILLAILFVLWDVLLHCNPKLLHVKTKQHLFMYPNF